MTMVMSFVFMGYQWWLIISGGLFMVNDGYWYLLVIWFSYWLSMVANDGYAICTY